MKRYCYHKYMAHDSEWNIYPIFHYHSFLLIIHKSRSLMNIQKKKDKTRFEPIFFLCKILTCTVRIYVRIEYFDKMQSLSIFRPK